MIIPPSLVDTGPVPPCPAPFNMAAHVLARAKDDPDRIALAILSLSGADRWSYGRLEQTVLGVAGALRSRGLTPGQRILMRLGNSVEFPILYLAALTADLVPVPTSAQLTVPEITRLATLLRPALTVAGPGVALPEHDAGTILPEAALHDMADHPPLAPAMGDPDRPAYIIFTSGTSGKPRGVVHAHRAIWARQMMLDGWYGLRRTDRLLHAGAFNWSYTLGTGLMDPWTVGATALIPAADVTPLQLPLLLKRHDATLFAAVPGVFRQMLRAPMPGLPRLRHGLSAGEKLPAPVRDAWQAATGTPIHEAFGMSECSTFLSGSPDRPAPPGLLGYPQTGRRIAILDSDAQPVPRGTVGVISVGANDPGLMRGYLDAPADTASRFSADGAWFLTGDRGRMEPDGAIGYLGRNDDLMNAGGYRVAPIEVEAALAAHPDIEEIAVTEVEIKPGVTVIAAFYTAATTLDAEELSAHASERLAHYKMPRVFVRMPQLPRSGNGKIRRRLLRDTWESRHDPA